MERPLVRIDLVKRTKNESSFDIDQLVTCKKSATHRVPHTFHRRLNELTRNRASGDLVFENKTLTRRRFDRKLDVRELSAATGLFFEYLFTRSPNRDRFTIGNLRFTDVCLDAEFAFHAVDDDLKMKFAHSGDDRLARFVIG